MNWCESVQKQSGSAHIFLFLCIAYECVLRSLVPGVESGVVFAVVHEFINMWCQTVDHDFWSVGCTMLRFCATIAGAGPAFIASITFCIVCFMTSMSIALIQFIHIRFTLCRELLVQFPDNDLQLNLVHCGKYSKAKLSINPQIDQ